MRVSFHQPAFIPWGGFFARLLFVDQTVLLDDTILARGFTFVNRNRLKGPNGEIWLTVPLKRKGRGQQKIRDLEIYEKKRWAKKFLLTLRHFYGKSIYFEPLYSRIAEAVNSTDVSFFHLVHTLLLALKEALGIATPLVRQSELGISGKGTDLLVSLAQHLKADEVLLSSFASKHVDFNRFQEKGIRVWLHRFDPPPYPQFWGEFCENLSALDLYLCLGRDGRLLLERSSRLIPWP